MALKNKTLFVCQECGTQSGKWLGRCPGCESWNSMQEEIALAPSKHKPEGFLAAKPSQPLSLEDISIESTPRFETKIYEFDRVLGGGFVPGSLLLLGGDPGIGKSTLILQTLDQLVKQNLSVLYVTGEESKEQIKIRALRLGITSPLTVVCENSLDQVMVHLEKLKPKVLVIDSIQTLFLSSLESAPGTVSQVRECAAKLLFYSKATGTTTILVGHVTKEGALAGPRILEHMVDTVLYFEGETTGQFRILRTIKNRFGSTNELGVFEMTALGLQEIKNPSQIFLGQKILGAPGSCITATLSGTRPLLTEVQALVTSSHMPQPRRTAIGLDSNRMALIIAVIEKYLGLHFYNQDIFVSITGGLKINEPSLDLAIALSLISSFKNKPLSGHEVAFGELGLSGELRPVSFADKRLRESSKMGYKNIILPKSSVFDSSVCDAKISTYSRLEDVFQDVF